MTEEELYHIFLHEFSHVSAEKSAVEKEKDYIIKSREKLRSLKCCCMYTAVRNGKPVLFVPVSSLIK